MSDYVPGTQRRGNRLFIHADPAVRTVATKKDYGHLINRIQMQLNKPLKGSACVIDIKHVYDDYAGVLQLLQRLIKWEEIEWTFNHYGTTITTAPEEVDRMKQIWDNPTMFDKQPTNKGSQS